MPKYSHLMANMSSSITGDANASANPYSLIETTKANNIEPHRYLVALFKKLPLADRRRLRGAAALEHQARRTVDRSARIGSDTMRGGVVH